MSFVLVNVGESFDQAYQFVAEAQNDLLCLLDEREALYSGYNPSEAGTAYSPYPLYAVIDGDGIISYLGRENDPNALTTAIEATLKK